ncbi:fimbrial protein [Serratia plymuthica]|uniref:Fimbria A protein n=1 Tax=Serratia plymuthica S13 TaxID=1348660 RepID=S4YQP3_SERPL|nr:fimbrial protein [Serratia plymuthica]AGP46495.1 fimbria A protein [Serratia plymuthica S13]ANJ93651.1 fimbria A protein [Serratia plymuthica]ANK00921.1 fimbria A protein [Serratia plymuthica]KYG17289.1 Fimbria A protein precursor [Serratia plymuthica]MBI6140047.1 type 1 fimbrial protein [Serratia plymuthica]
MKLNKFMLAAVLALGATSMMAQADIKNQGRGTVTFKGAIIDAPCSITPETVDQTVNLGQVSNVALKDGGKSTPKNFQIKLENCDLNPGSGTPVAGKNNAVSITFSGAASSFDPNLLGITGVAKGASIAITDGSGEVIKLGQATKAQTLQNGNNTLSFAAYLQGSKASSAAVIPGEFQSVADFTLAYQ